MCQLGIIEPISNPTNWVSQKMIVAKKDESIHLCINPRSLNKTIKRSHFSFQTIDEIAAQMEDVTIFCKSDALCTFQTPFWRYKCNRLPFGISSAPEIFYRVMV